MPIVMQLLGYAGIPNPRASLPDVDGHYVKSVDVQRHGRDDGWLVTTPDIDAAYRWPDRGAAFATWSEIVRSAPERSDGKPNRPLTAFNVQFFDPERMT